MIYKRNSNEFTVSEFQAGSRTFNSSIHFDMGRDSEGTYMSYEATDDIIMNWSVESSIESDVLSIGAAIPKKAEVSLYDSGDFRRLIKKAIEIGNEIRFFIYISKDSKPILLGNFNIDYSSIVIDEKVVSFNAFDEMYEILKYGKIYTPWATREYASFEYWGDKLPLPYKITAPNTDYETQTERFDSFEFYHIWNSMETTANANIITINTEEVLKVLAVYYGANVIISYDENENAFLNFVRVKNVEGISFNTTNYSEFKKNSITPQIITGITAPYTYVSSETEGEPEYTTKTLTYGNTNGYVISFEENMFCGDRDIHLCGNKCIPIQINPFEMNAPSIPILEAGDVISIQDRENVITTATIGTHKISYNGGLVSEFSLNSLPIEDTLNAQTNSSVSSTGGISSAVDTLTSKMKYLFADKGTTITSYGLAHGCITTSSKQITFEIPSPFINGKLKLNSLTIKEARQNNNYLFAKYGNKYIPFANLADNREIISEGRAAVGNLISNFAITPVHNGNGVRISITFVNKLCTNTSGTLAVNNTPISFNINYSYTVN